MKLAVAFTEYQLIQIQALIEEYGLDEVELILIDNNRIQDWLIDKDKFEQILLLPAIVEERHERIYKKYIQRYEKHLRPFIDGKQVDLMIGAQDENTIFALIRRISNPSIYWSIEDGFANYYHRNAAFKIDIAFKKLLFKFIYGYDLPIRYGHGMAACEKSFRIAPDLSIDESRAVPSGGIMHMYLEGKAQGVKSQLSFLENYRNVTKLIITDLNTFTRKKIIEEKATVYKFHPKDTMNTPISVNYIKEKVPLELLPFFLKNLNTVRFEVMSSSLLNIVEMNLDLKVEIAFEFDKPLVKRLVNYILENFSNKVQIVDNY